MWFETTVVIWRHEKKPTEVRQTFNLSAEMGSQEWNWHFTNGISNTYQYSQGRAIYQLSFIRILKLLGAHISVPRGWEERLVPTQPWMGHREAHLETSFQLQQHVHLMIPLKMWGSVTEYQVQTKWLVSTPSMKESTQQMWFSMSI